MTDKTQKNSVANSTFPRIWFYDVNRRVYKKNKDGRSYGSPIEFHCWSEIEIVDETSRSWISKRGQKVPKKCARGFCFSKDEVLQKCFVAENRHKISELVRQLEYCELKKVAEIIGYDEEAS